MPLKEGKEPTHENDFALAARGRAWRCRRLILFLQRLQESRIGHAARAGEAIGRVAQSAGRYAKNRCRPGGPNRHHAERYPGTDATAQPGETIGRREGAVDQAIDHRSIASRALTGGSPAGASARERKRQGHGGTTNPASETKPGGSE